MIVSELNHNRGNAIRWARVREAATNLGFNLFGAACFGLIALYGLGLFILAVAGSLR